MAETLKFLNKEGYNSVELYIFKGELTVEIENAWYGDSESGFGATLSMTLTKAQQKELYYWLRGQLITRGVING